MNDTRIPVGHMEVNAVECLGRLSSATSASTPGVVTLHDLSTESDDEEEDTTQPHFDRRSRIFELDPCDGCGKVCLVYNNCKPGVPASKPQIWLLDRSLSWHFLVEDFLSYYRLLLLHVGLPQWQYAFTDLGLSPQAKQWFHMYAPMRLDLLAFNVPLTDHSKAQGPTNALDAARVFKGKGDKKKVLNALNTKKKPLPVPSKTTTQSLTRGIGASQPFKPPK